jgi:glutaryl-CoA dehydrogenase
VLAQPAEDAMNLATGLGHALGTDYYLIREQLSAQHTGYLDRIRAFVEDHVLPVIGGYCERVEFAWPLVEKLGPLGIVGDGSAATAARRWTNSPRA